MRFSLCTLLVLSTAVVDAFGSSLSARSSVRSKWLEPSFGRQKVHKSQRVESLRGGFTDPTGVVTGTLEYVTRSPSSLYNTCLLSLTCAVIAWKASAFSRQPPIQKQHEKPSGVGSLQFRFLSVFWLVRMADWLQGPYFFEAYSSKMIGGQLAPAELVSKIFLAGFVMTGAFGPFLGRLVDGFGRKKGTLAFTVLYGISALSTRSSNLAVLLLGRIAGGLGTSLLFSAPEAWLVSEHNRGKYDGKWLGETFGWAFAGDSLVAILAGQLAGLAAQRAGPTGPFVLSIAFLLAGAAVVASQWGENVAKAAATADALNPSVQDKPQKTLWDITTKVNKTGDSSKLAAEVVTTPSQKVVRNAVSVMLNDRRILLVGAVQALFEGAMYIFVLQWAPLLKTAIQSTDFGSSALVPYGNIFSCFMASCLLGSTVYSSLQKRGTKVEKSAAYMLMTATAALTAATVLGTGHLLPLSAALFLFEACVGMYFPSISSLRSKYLPDQHRSVLMNLFGIPLNLIVVSVFLSLKTLGTQGALYIASGALGLATICMTLLHNMSEQGSSDGYSQ